MSKTLIRVCLYLIFICGLLGCDQSPDFSRDGEIPSAVTTNSEEQSASHKTGSDPSDPSSPSNPSNPSTPPGPSIPTPAPQSITLSFWADDIRKDNSLMRSVDVLFVIDNSDSMAAWQTAVKDNTQLFMEQFSKVANLDTKFGLISTTTADDPYVGFKNSLALNDPALISKFQAAVTRLGLGGDGLEKTFIPVKKALSQYPSFHRVDALLALIVISDGPEQSYLGDFGYAPMYLSDFIRYMKQTTGGDHNVLGYGAFGPQPQCTQTDDPWMWNNSAYQRFIDAFSGKWFSICSPAFGQDLAGLANDLIQHSYSARVSLVGTPDFPTIVVRNNGNILDPSYYVVSPAQMTLTFSDFSFARSGDQITVTYFLRP